MIIRFLCLLVLFSFVLYAQNCYSVALWSVPKKFDKTGLDILHKSECKIFEISSQITQRCGCYESVSEAKVHLKSYIKFFPTAYIAPTLRSRFTQEIKKTVPQKILLKSKKVEKKHKFKFLDQKFRLDTFENNLTVNSSKMALQKNKKLLDKHLKNESDFYGLNIYANYDQYFNQNYLDRKYTDYESKIQLKFELFKNGYFEHKKDKLFRMKETKYRYFKELSLIDKNKFSDMLLILDKLKNRISAYYYSQLASLYESMIIEKREAFEKSLITSYDFELLERYKKRYLRLAQIYTKNRSITISDNFYKLFQNIEYLQLMEMDKLISYAKQHNSDINIKDSQIALFDTETNYSERVKMNLYVNRREVDELGWYNTVGIEANLPIDFSTQERREFLKLQKNSKEIAKESIEKSITSRLKKAYISFENLQELIDLDKDDILFFRNRVKKFEIIREKSISALNFDPDEKIVLNEKKILELKYAVLLKRVQLYKLLNEIAYISDTEDIKNIIKEKI